MGGRDAGASAVVLAVAVLGLSIPAQAWAGPGPLAFEVRIRHAPTADTLREALRGAGERLARPECQAVFSDFSDASGTPLAELLAQRGETPQAYLGRVLFYDGSTSQPHCRGRGKGVLAVTAPGSPVVFVCSQAFRELHRNQPLYAEATLIHEILHTLGLGEDPPSSREITSRVVRRCQR